MRTDRLTKTYNVRLQYTHFPLHPDTPREGRSLDELFANHPAALSTMRARLPVLMANEGLPYGDRSMTYNSRLAQELATFTERTTGNMAIHDALFRAYFVDGLNLADPDVLVRVGASVGLSKQTVRAVIRDRRCKEDVDRDWARAMEGDVTAVPTYVIGERGLVGAQPYRALEELAVQAGATRRDV